MLNRDSRADELAHLLDCPDPQTSDPDMQRLMNAAAALRPKPGLTRQAWRQRTKEAALRAFDGEFAAEPAAPSMHAGSRDGVVEPHTGHVVLESEGVIAHVADVEPIEGDRINEVGAALSGIVERVRATHGRS